MSLSTFFIASSHGRTATLALAVAAFFALSGCSRKIGDPCTISADCGLTSNRQCDTSQLGGYCTQIGCTANGCPGEAACFLFGPRIRGCTYDDRETARTSRSFCMLSCDADNDCRDGYVCADVTAEPWTAVLLDTLEVKPKACIVPATFITAGALEDTEPAVCAPTGSAAASGDAGADDDSAADAGDTSADAGP